MPITGPSSYLPTMELFLSHWTDVNTALGVGNPLKVGQPNPAGGLPVLKVRADLDTLKAELIAARDLVTNETVNLAVQRELVRDSMAVLLARFNQFTSSVRSRYAGRAFARSLPNAPSVGDSPETFSRPMEKAGVLWSKIDASLAPAALQLGEGTVGDPFFEHDNFSEALDELRAAALETHRVEQKLKTLIEERNDIQEVIAPLLRDYRQAVAGRFTADHALVDSLPRFSPPPGNKPDAPELNSALWNEATTQADITFTPSTSDDVVRHELRICAGAEYDADLETIDGSLAAGQPPVFHTASLLGTPGAIISARIYAITADDRESVSQALSVQRPAP